MFQLKDFASIVLSMINRAQATQSRLTDFNVGSVARTLIEAPAIEIEELYQRIFAGIMDAIPVAIYRGFNFALAEPTKARGLVLIEFAGPIVEAFTIPAGTIFLAPATGLRYLVEADTTAMVGATSLSVVVVAAETGAAYNADVNAISSVTGFTLPVGAVIGSQALTSGSDGETEVERMTRFTAYIQSIARGTVASVEYAAASAKVLDEDGAVVEYVTRVGSSEVPGRIDVFIHGSGGPASASLVAAAQRLIDGYYDPVAGQFVSGYRAAGVDALVLPMDFESFDAEVTVSLAPGYALDAAMSNAIIGAISDVIESVHAGQTLYVDNIHTAVLSVVGVLSVRSNLTENFVCPANVVLIPGVIGVSDA